MIHFYVHECRVRMYAVEVMQIWSFCIITKFNNLSSGVRVNKEIKRVGPKSFIR